MNLLRLQRISHLVAIAIMVASFILPFTQAVDAEEVHAEHRMTEMDCDNGACEPNGDAETCLEHCLQNASPEVTTLYFPPRTQTSAALTPHLNTEWSNRSAERTNIQITGPPHRKSAHLTTQKRE